MPDTAKISIIIPTHNGWNLLRENLVPLHELAAREVPETEIIVVDDASTDDTVDQLKRLPFSVRIVRNKHKSSFAATCNNGARHARGDLLLFLNNDMRVGDTLLAPLTPHFDDDAVFAVAPSSMVEMDETMIDEVPNTGVWERGFLSIKHISNPASPVTDIFHASGGCMCVRADRFRQLGGFDERFSPFYFEDADLCWRARKRGWRVLHEPDAVLLHESHATIDTLYSALESDIVYWKNYFLFVWKNITDESLFNDHADNLPENLFYYARHGHGILQGFKLALRLFISPDTDSVPDGSVSDKQLLNVHG